MYFIRQDNKYLVTEEIVSTREEQLKFMTAASIDTISTYRTHIICVKRFYTIWGAKHFAKKHKLMNFKIEPSHPIYRQDNNLTW